MNLFASITVFSFCMLFHLLLVDSAPTSTTKKSTTTTKASSSSAKSLPTFSITSLKSTIVTSKSSSTGTTKIPSTLSSTTTYPTPTVPIGAGGGPLATVNGRMFQIQSKTQYFAGMAPYVMMRNTGDSPKKGTNAWWLGQLQSNTDVFNVFADLALVSWLPTIILPIPSNRLQSQLKVARVWGFSETNNAATASGVYFQVLNSSGQYFNFDSNTGRAEQADIQERAQLTVWKVSQGSTTPSQRRKLKA